MRWWIVIRGGVECVNLKSRYAIIGFTSGISEWVSCTLIHTLISWQYLFVWFVSLGNQYGNVYIIRSGFRGIRILTFVMISHIGKGVWKRIWRSLVGLAVQPSVFQIVILGCGRFRRLFFKVLPDWWDVACFRIRHSTKLIVKYYVVLLTEATCGGIP